MKTVATLVVAILGLGCAAALVWSANTSPWASIASFLGTGVFAFWIWYVGPPRPWIAPVALLACFVGMFVLVQLRHEIGPAGLTLMCGLIFGGNMGLYFSSSRKKNGAIGK